MVVAHPDDEVLGCAGTLEKHRANGDTVEIWFGSVSRRDPLDQRFDCYPIRWWIDFVRKSIEGCQPDIIYTHCSSDLNLDHRIINEAVMVATRPPCSVKELYGFDVTSDWAFNQFGSFRPNVFVDITPYLEAKLDAMRDYKDEARESPHPRSCNKIRALAERWGSVIGVPFAEAFEMIRMIK